MAELTVQMLENEYWWAGYVSRGHEMPYHKASVCSFDLNGEEGNDQFMPLMLSSKGRYIWSEDPFRADIAGGTITLYGSDDLKLYEGYENLRGAYLSACQAHFPFSGSLPAPEFFKMPQYNTWIEVGADQTTEKILAYAKGILENGMPAGVLMIDGGWHEAFGMYEEFNRRKVPDPKYLVDELHRMGFKVMVWVSPIVDAAGPVYEKIRDMGFLIRNRDGEIAIRKWWSGYSAVMDFSNPEAVSWQCEMLDSLRERYGVDGFKFDAGDGYFYEDDDIIFRPMKGRHQTAEFNKLGLYYPFNEFRAAWKFGGQAIAARLQDKFHCWDTEGLAALIPHTLAQGLSGYAYCCPDMVGGGQIADVNNGAFRYDEELFVRWAQVNALMGMMQISRSPWKALSPLYAEKVKQAIRLHASLGEEIYALAEQSAKTGEPITRHMAYAFPDEDFETVNDQFMLGDRILSAPVLTKGAVTRTVKLPKGRWQYVDGTVYEGGVTVTVPADIDTIPYFVRA